MREHSARVYRLAYRLSGNAQDAEDLTQETFIRVFRSLSSFSPGTFEGWLHRITTNLFLDMVRRRQRIRFDALPEDTERIAGSAPSPEQVYTDTHLDPQVQAALDALPPDFRVASSCATSRASATRRSRRPWASSWARCAAASTAAGCSCARRWRTWTRGARRPRSADRPFSRTGPAVHTARAAAQDGP